MSDLVLTLLRLSYLVLLWLMVLVCIGVLRRDIFGTRISDRFRSRKNQTDDGDAPPTRSPTVTLVVLEGPLAGTRLTLTTSAVLIGRSPSATLVVEDDFASGRHARIFPHDGGWYLEDLGSTNGTWLAGHRVEGPEPIGMGQQIKVGSTVLELRGTR